MPTSNEDVTKYRDRQNVPSTRKRSCSLLAARSPAPSVAPPFLGADGEGDRRPDDERHIESLFLDPYVAEALSPGPLAADVPLPLGSASGICCRHDNVRMATTESPGSPSSSDAGKSSG
eukprot:gene8079-biopygen6721